jgi:protein SCO1
MGAHNLGTSILCVACFAVFTACNEQSSSPQPDSSTDSGRKEFKVRGVVQELRPAEKEVVIKHEEIPGYMAAMTMPFEVKNTNELKGLNTNDQVTFIMVVTEKEGWIEGIRKIGVDTNSVPGSERPKVRIVRDVEVLEIGDKVPNYTFTNSFGQTVSLTNFTGQAYAFTFIFTRCPFPNFCPRMNSNFADAYKLLMSRRSGPTNWHLLSISFDPQFDTAARLKEYSAHYQPDPAKWDWVTGAQIEIDAIADQVELAFAFENGTFNHNLRTAVVDKDGRLRKLFRGNEWKPEEFVEEIIAGAEGRPIPKPE